MGSARPGTWKPPAAGPARWAHGNAAEYVPTLIVLFPLVGAMGTYLFGIASVAAAVLTMSVASRRRLINENSTVERHRPARTRGRLRGDLSRLAVNSLVGPGGG